ncbi:transcription repressor OFP7-like [Chenopodium quinoa]|uniref:Transcription repressor n=1 Tax=Chenopodium quinoa TaxID=63459 RepID=A0A803L806_CHEQI|nr:transcription repressor OFP7-like [Chenopodium quinoa]
MRKNFMKFRVSRVIPTFHSCRSKHPSTLPSNPVPSFLHHSSSTSTAATATTLNKQINLPTTPSSSRSSTKRHVSSAISSARRGCLRSHPSPEPSHTESSPKLKLPSHHWHFITKLPQEYHNYDSTPPRRKIYNSAASDTDHENDVVFLPPKTKTRPGRKNRRRRRNFQKVRISTSSDSGIFSDDNQERETETLVSTDSTSPKVNKKSKERESKKNPRSSFELPAPARLSAFMRKMTPCKAVVDGKVRESFAIVKRSEDPLDDFKRSMIEMVVEKQMFEEKELEELLRCFLSLNSERHHEAIVRAFTEIWDGLFCQSSE